MAGEIAWLISLLDDDSAGTAEDVKAALISMSGEMPQPLVAVFGYMDRYGQRSATEVFEHFGDPATGSASNGLLAQRGGL